MSGETFDLDKQQLMQREFDQMENKLPGAIYSLRQKVALTCRILFDNGHDSGLAGQITARGEVPGTFLTQRLGFGFDEISAGNLLLVDEDLLVLEGEGMPNPANRFHSWVYRARPDVHCIVHSHALHTAALSMLETPLIISHMDNCVLYGDVAFLPKWPGVPVGNEEGGLIAEALGSKRALMLAHHGLLVACSNVEEACLIALAFERAARMQLLASAVGEIQPIDPTLGREAHDWILHAQRSASAFAYYARRSLKHCSDCL
ncbi:aldolase [Nitrosomonas eutropha]|uniref:L-fuculose-phosphate aldolase n=2 Tax=Nitrosomonas eutropha TaxID=916 RepID=A0ABX5M7U2_9PROT|nr:aldolase [Nitrosomonas eutropha]ABI58503.1 class II aldolase/adducin family protein [Nitrosomonas eutropha C91]PXV82297.1 L-fuculose-phosphate aldolase [Nitrosomonas eutropha]SEI69557.1 L-fuculose-phosphate aldolase [Nitrosomonas eutropha]